jgi:hypothetical protein
MNEHDCSGQWIINSISIQKSMKISKRFHFRTPNYLTGVGVGTRLTNGSVEVGVGTLLNGNNGTGVEPPLLLQLMGVGPPPIGVGHPLVE